MDTFHTKIRVIITQSWQSTRTKNKFRGFNPDESFAFAIGLEEYSQLLCTQRGLKEEDARKLIDSDLESHRPEIMRLGGIELNRQLDEGAAWGCGDSANRLCELLAADEMNDMTGSVDITNDADVKAMYLDIAKANKPILAKILVDGSGVGHAYVFVSGLRSNPLEGYIYQTNVGIRNREYDLLEWIRDAKSEQSIYLPGHLAELAGRFLGAIPDAVVDRVSVYTSEFLLTGQTIPDDKSGGDKSPREKVEGAKARILVRWKPVDPTKAFERLEAAIS